MSNPNEPMAVVRTAKALDVSRASKNPDHRAPNSVDWDSLSKEERHKLIRQAGKVQFGREFRMAESSWQTLVEAARLGVIDLKHFEKLRELVTGPSGNPLLLVQKTPFVLPESTPAHRKAPAGVRQYRSLAEAVPAGPTEIWYWKTPDKTPSGVDWFVNTNYAPQPEHGYKGIKDHRFPTAEEVRRDYVFLGTTKETEPERIYAMMQGERWSPKGEAFTLVVESGAQHTTMGVGDVVRLPDGRWLGVAKAGFVELPKGEQAPPARRDENPHWVRRTFLPKEEQANRLADKLRAAGFTVQVRSIATPGGIGVTRSWGVFTPATSAGGDEIVREYLAGEGLLRPREPWPSEAIVGPGTQAYFIPRGEANPHRSRFFPAMVWVYGIPGLDVNLFLEPSDAIRGAVNTHGYILRQGPRGGWRWEHPTDVGRYVPVGGGTYDWIDWKRHKARQPASVQTYVEDEAARWAREHPGLATRQVSANPVVTVPDLDDPAYSDYSKLRGYRAPQNVFSTVSASDAGKLLRQRLPTWTKEFHEMAAHWHMAEASRKNKEWGIFIDHVAKQTWGRSFEVIDYRVSCVGSDKFGEKDKDVLRKLCQDETRHRKAARAHWAAAGRRIPLPQPNPHVPEGVKPTIEYVTGTLYFHEEVDDIDTAQSILDGFRIAGVPAAAIHERGKHQIYVARPEENPPPAKPPFDVGERVIVTTRKDEKEIPGVVKMVGWLPFPGAWSFEVTGDDGVLYGLGVGRVAIKRIRSEAENPEGAVEYPDPREWTERVIPAHKDWWGGDVPEERVWLKFEGVTGASIEPLNGEWQLQVLLPYYTPGEPQVLSDDRFPTLEAAQKEADEILASMRAQPGRVITAFHMVEDLPRLIEPEFLPRVQEAAAARDVGRLNELLAELGWLDLRADERVERIEMFPGDRLALMMSEPDTSPEENPRRRGASVTAPVRWERENGDWHGEVTEDLIVWALQDGGKWYATASDQLGKEIERMGPFESAQVAKDEAEAFAVGRILRSENPRKPWTKEQEDKVQNIFWKSVNGGSELQVARGMIKDREPISKEIGVPPEIIRAILEDVFPQLAGKKVKAPPRRPLRSDVPDPKKDWSPYRWYSARGEAERVAAEATRIKMPLIVGMDTIYKVEHRPGEVEGLPWAVMYRGVKRGSEAMMVKREKKNPLTRWEVAAVADLAEGLAKREAARQREDEDTRIAGAHEARAAYDELLRAAVDTPAMMVRRNPDISPFEWRSRAPFATCREAERYAEERRKKQDVYTDYALEARVVEQPGAVLPGFRWLVETRAIRPGGSEAIMVERNPAEPPREGGRSPWGMIDYVESLAPGVWRVGTPGHGGVKLDRGRNQGVHQAWRGAGGWYEEDLEWNIAAFTYPEAFPRVSREEVKQTLRDWIPDQWVQVTGEVLTPTQSRTLAEREARARHAQDWVVISAVGDWAWKVPKGMVRVTATRGGSREPGAEKNCFLVPGSEYEARTGPIGFVVDPTRHGSTECLSPYAPVGEGNPKAKVVRRKLPDYGPSWQAAVPRSHIEQMIDEFVDVPLTEDDTIERPFYGWPAGEPRIEILQWFDEKLPGGIGPLLGSQYLEEPEGNPAWQRVYEGLWEREYDSGHRAVIEAVPEAGAPTPYSWYVEDPRGVVVADGIAQPLSEAKTAVSEAVRKHAKKTATKNPVVHRGREVRNLRQIIADFNRRGVQRIDIKRLPNLDGHLTVTWDDGTTSTADFASFSVLADFIDRRRALRGAKVVYIDLGMGEGFIGPVEAGKVMESWHSYKTGQAALRQRPLGANPSIQDEAIEAAKRDYVMSMRAGRGHGASVGSAEHALTAFYQNRGHSLDKAITLSKQAEPKLYEALDAMKTIEGFRGVSITLGKAREEEDALLHGDVASLWIGGGHVGDFRPDDHQYRIIQSGKGTIHIHEDQFIGPSGNPAACPEGMIRRDPYSYTRADGTRVEVPSTCVKDVGEPGKTPKEERWAELREGKLYGWSKDLPQAARREILAKAARKDSFATISRRLVALANVTPDKETERIARADREWLAKNREKLGLGAEENPRAVKEIVYEAMEWVVSALEYRKHKDIINEERARSKAFAYFNSLTPDEQREVFAVYPRIAAYVQGLKRPTSSIAETAGIDAEKWITQAGKVYEPASGAAANPIPSPDIVDKIWRHLSAAIDDREDASRRSSEYLQAQALWGVLNVREQEDFGRRWRNARRWLESPDDEEAKGGVDGEWRRYVAERFPHLVRMAERGGPSSPGERNPVIERLRAFVRTGPKTKEEAERQIASMRTQTARVKQSIVREEQLIRQLDERMKRLARAFELPSPNPKTSKEVLQNLAEALEAYFNAIEIGRLDMAARAKGWLGGALHQLTPEEQRRVELTYPALASFTRSEDPPAMVPEGLYGEMHALFRDLSLGRTPFEMGAEANPKSLDAITEEMVGQIEAIVRFYRAGKMDRVDEHRLMLDGLTKSLTEEERAAFKSAFFPVQDILLDRLKEKRLPAQWIEVNFIGPLVRKTSEWRAAHPEIAENPTAEDYGRGTEEWFRRRGRELESLGRGAGRWAKQMAEGTGAWVERRGRELREATENPQTRREIERAVAWDMRIAIREAQMGNLQGSSEILHRAVGRFRSLSQPEQDAWKMKYPGMGLLTERTPFEWDGRMAGAALAEAQRVLMPGQTNPVRVESKDIIPEVRDLIRAVKADDKAEEERVRARIAKKVGTTGVIPAGLTDEEKADPDLLARRITCAVEVKERGDVEEPIAVCRASVNPYHEGNPAACPEGEIRRDPYEYTTKRGTHVEVPSGCVKDRGKKGKTPKRERWFVAERGRLRGWDKDMPAGQRREIVAKIAREEGFLTAKNRVIGLANVTADRETEKALRSDYEWLARNREKLGLGREENPLHPDMIKARIIQLADHAEEGLKALRRGDAIGHYHEALGMWNTLTGPEQYAMKDAGERLDTLKKALFPPAEGEGRMVGGILWARLNKQDTLADYEREVGAGPSEYTVENVLVDEIRVLSPEQWDEFTHSLLKDRDWLAGKGGTGSTTAPDKPEWQYTSEDYDQFRKGAYRIAVEVRGPEGKVIYVDPQGYDYARYVGLPPPAAQYAGRARAARSRTR